MTMPAWMTEANAAAALPQPEAPPASKGQFDDSRSEGRSSRGDRRESPPRRNGSSHRDRSRFLFSQLWYPFSNDLILMQDHENLLDVDLESAAHTETETVVAQPKEIEIEAVAVEGGVEEEDQTPLMRLPRSGCPREKERHLTAM